MQTFLRKCGDLLLDLVFPRECLACSCDGSYLCLDCVYRLPSLRQQACPICEIENFYGENCCESALDQLLVASDYDNDVIPTAIHLFKYRFSRGLADNLAVFLVNILKRYVNWPCLIVPIPLHRKRLRYRGFNQSALLAESLASSLGLAYAEILKRIKHTNPQAELNKAKREQNMKNAFAIDWHQLQQIPHYQHVILVDDVYTTGSTMREAALTLKKAGFSYVTGLVLARSYLSKSRKS